MVGLKGGLFLKVKVEFEKISIESKIKSVRVQTKNRMLGHLQNISKEATSCTLVSNKGERVEVQAFLLAAASPFLASLLSQASNLSSISIFMHTIIVIV